MISHTIAEKGKSHYLVRSTRKRKYKGNFIEDIYDDHSQLIQEQKSLKGDIESLKKELDTYHQKEKDYQEQEDILASLYEEGVIDENGRLKEEFKNS